MSKILQILACIGLIFFIYGCSTPRPAFVESAPTPKNFTQSKAILKKAYQKYHFTQEFYCRVEFDTTTLKIIPSPKYTPRNALTKQGKPNIRAQRIEFEHIMPAHRFGKDLPCWQNGGRKACAKDKKFAQMESDLRNLVPAIGEINADRSNYEYADAPEEIVFSQYGACEVYTDFKAKRFYPAVYSKGFIARVYLYMSEKYGIVLESKERVLMQQWDKLYPPSEYENELLRTQQIQP